jgi:dTDP-L-rhamnose 4-epimerase
VTRVVSLLGEAYGVTPRAEVSGRFRCGDIRHNFADTARAARDLGFTWSVPLEEGIRAFSAWVRQQETPPSLYGISAEELSRRNLLKGGK